MHQTEAERTSELVDAARTHLYRRTDLLFGVLFVVQLVGGIIAAVAVAPRTWAGESSSIHLHVWAGIILSVLICSMPLALVALLRGQAITRYTIAVAQMLFSALLIHLSGGRIEAHFHIFGSLAFLACYRDWRVLVPATVVVAIDHGIRSVLWPESVFGVLVASPLRAFEHAAWVVFEGIFLVASCVQAEREMRAVGRTRAELESERGRAEQLVLQRTRQLEAQTAALASSEQQFRRAIKGSRDGIWDWDLTTNHMYFAPRWCELMGCSEDELTNSPDEWVGRIASEHLPRFNEALASLAAGVTESLDIEFEAVLPGGDRRWMLCRATAERDEAGDAVRLAGAVSDISELKLAQERLRRMAHQDRLTGLPNREVFLDRLAEALDRAKHEPGYRFAVLFGDFDGFKVINDGLGHAVGDKLLVSIAERMRTAVREQDTVARFGGDEFVVLLNGVTSQADAECCADRIIEVCSKPHHLDSRDIVSTLSLGLVMGPASYEAAAEMLRDADAAMYQAKIRGKGRYQIFDEGLRLALVNRLNTERDLRRAVSDHGELDRQFKLVYQPIVNLSDGAIVGFEALVRWRHPVEGSISPNRFIGIAEDTGLIVPIGEWVLRRACEQMRAWRDAIGPGRFVQMHVNLSRRQVVHPDLIAMLRRTLEETGVRPEDLKLEITETAIMDERVDAVSVMKRIRKLGIGIAMDDFGTGQSSLSCLRQFPIQTLKVDRSFLLNMTQRREFTAVMNAIVTLANHLDLNVVAEGIENKAQLMQLQALDCPQAQGYYFSRPVDNEIAAEILHGSRRLDSESEPLRDCA